VASTAFSCKKLRKNVFPIPGNTTATSRRMGVSSVLSAALEVKTRVELIPSAVLYYWIP
jgi:hypothetical protein